MQFALIITDWQLCLAVNQTSGSKSELIKRLLLHASEAICKVFLESFDAESLNKLWNCALLKIQAQKAWTISVVGFVSLFTSV